MKNSPGINQINKQNVIVLILYTTMNNCAKSKSVETKLIALTSVTIYWRSTPNSTLTGH